MPKRWGAVMVLMCNNMGDIRVWGQTLHQQLLAGQWREAANQMRHYRNARDAAGVLRPVLGLRRAWAEIRHVDDWPALPG